MTYLLIMIGVEVEIVIVVVVSIGVESNLRNGGDEGNRRLM